MRLAGCGTTRTQGYARARALKRPWAKASNAARSHERAHVSVFGARSAERWRPYPSKVGSERPSDLPSAGPCCRVPASRHRQVRLRDQTNAQKPGDHLDQRPHSRLAEGDPETHREAAGNHVARRPNGILVTGRQMLCRRSTWCVVDAANSSDWVSWGRLPSLPGCLCTAWSGGSQPLGAILPAGYADPAAAVEQVVGQLPAERVPAENDAKAWVCRCARPRRSVAATTARCLRTQAGSHGSTQRAAPATFP